MISQIAIPIICMCLSLSLGVMVVASLPAIILLIMKRRWASLFIYLRGTIILSAIAGFSFYYWKKFKDEQGPNYKTRMEWIALATLPIILMFVPEPLRRARLHHLGAAERESSIRIKRTRRRRESR